MKNIKNYFLYIFEHYVIINAEFISILTTPNINPKTKHKDGDIYYRLQLILKDLEPFVEKELKKSKEQ